MYKPTALKIAIFNSGERQMAIAKRAGLNESRLSKLANGHEDPTEDEQKALAKALRKPRAELFQQANEATA